MKAKQVCLAVMAIALAACSGGNRKTVSLEDMPVVAHQEVRERTGADCLQP